MVKKIIVFSVLFCILCIFSLIVFFQTLAGNYLIGEYSLEGGNYHEAIERFSRCIDSQYKLLPSYIKRGNAYRKIGDNQSAISDLSTALKLQPESSNLLALRGALFHKEKRYSEAANDYKDALEKLPEDDRIINNLAWLYATAADESVRNGKLAVTLVNRALKLNRSAGALDTLAAAYAEYGDFSHAIKVQKEAISLLDKNEKSKFLEFSRRLESYEKHVSWRDSGSSDI